LSISTFKTENIKNSFAASGLVPIDPEKCLGDSIFNSLQGSQSTNSAPKTPHNLKQLEKQASTIKKLLRQRTQSPRSRIKSALNQLVKGCDMTMNSAIILTKENQDLRAAHEKQAQKKKRSKRQIAHTGGLSIQEGIELMQQKNVVHEAQDTIQTETAPSTSQFSTTCTGAATVF